MGEKKNIAIKICGMRDHENIMEVATLSPQYFGFIFYAKSPRFVGEDFSLPKNLPRSIKKVGVFVNEGNATILLKAKKIGLEFIQLHGNEKVAQAEELKAAGLGVIKVFSVNDEFTFDETTPFKKTVDYFLFDTKGKFYGGNAETFNWNILRKYDQEIPFFLSGGLSPENVHNVNDIVSMNIHALDLNSGVEFSPGLKSLEKIKSITQIATNFEL
ncbi:phosphoribosylanthranilate isomerase [Chryseolinea sp. H1M3-3]|uniref:phosphoribosylanthranilate isomerase n=1 Tax=Chryseolinea sp. H1M3-3 TaxID=3034144 RepID=UPI0023EC0E53|nr:phosphoribosylanthranilate isomerase [Chryseolinea sp. H1M3-3]